MILFQNYEQLTKKSKFLVKHLQNTDINHFPFTNDIETKDEFTIFYHRRNLMTFLAWVSYIIMTPTRIESTPKTTNARKHYSG